MDPYSNPGISRFLLSTTTRDQSTPIPPQTNYSLLDQNNQISPSREHYHNHQTPNASTPPGTTNKSESAFSTDNSTQSPLKRNHSVASIDSSHSVKTPNTPKMTIPIFRRSNTSGSVGSASIKSHNSTDEPINENSNPFVQPPTLACDDFFPSVGPSPNEPTPPAKDSPKYATDVQPSTLKASSSSLKRSHVSLTAMEKVRSYQSLKNNTELEVFQSDDSLCPSSSSPKLDFQKRNIQNKSHIGNNSDSTPKNAPPDHHGKFYSSCLICLSFVSNL